MTKLRILPLAFSAGVASDAFKDSLRHVSSLLRTSVQDCDQAERIMYRSGFDFIDYLDVTHDSVTPDVSSDIISALDGISACASEAVNSEGFLERLLNPTPVVSQYEGLRLVFSRLCEEVKKSGTSATASCTNFQLILESQYSVSPFSILAVLLIVAVGLGMLGTSAKTHFYRALVS